MEFKLNVASSRNSTSAAKLGIIDSYFAHRYEKVVHPCFKAYPNHIKAAAFGPYACLAVPSTAVMCDLGLAP